MKINNREEVKNNNRLCDAVVSGIMPEVLEIFEIPIKKSGYKIENIAIINHIETQLQSTFVGLVNLLNLAKAMHVLCDKGLYDMSKDTVHEFYCKSSQGLVQNTFVLIDGFVSKEFHCKRELDVADDMVMAVYGDKYKKFAKLMRSNLEHLADFGMPI